MRKSRIFLAAAFFVCVLPLSIPLCLGGDSQKLKDALSGFGISMKGADDFDVRKNIIREGRENSFCTVSAEKGQAVLRIEAVKNLSASAAKSYIEERVYMIEALYKRLPSPYPGMVSKAIDCPAEFSPKSEYIALGGQRATVYILSATPRFTYGACAQDLIKYRAALMFIYCQKKETLYRLEMFVPKEKFEKTEVLNIFETFNCGCYAEKNSQANGATSFLPAWKDCKNCNLIVVGLEPLGARHVGAYGYPKDTTPYLDKFAAASFLFKNAVSPSSWTLPVFMSWFTSLYPSQHKLINKYSTYTDKEQVTSSLSDLSPSVVTLAQVLKKNGYATAGFTGGAGVGGEFGYNLGFDTYYDTTAFGGFDTVMPKALEWIGRHKKDKFFVFLLGYDVHGRYPLPADAGKFLSKNYKGKYKGTPEEYWELRNQGLDQGYLGINDDDAEFWKGCYDAKIHEADRKFGDFLNQLKDMGVSDNTIIIFSSGSGNELYEHKLFDHGYSLYDELISVPLVINVPGVRGKEIAGQVRTIDIMPTVLDMLGLKQGKTVKSQMQGTSLVALMRGGNLQLDAFSETDYLLQVFKRSLRTADGWKFIYSMDTEDRELYNLKKDPYETNNLVEGEKNKACELEEKLFKWLQSLGQDRDYHRAILKGMLTEK